MVCNILIQQTFLPLESIKLGRFLLNVDHPEQDYLDPACTHTPEIITKTHVSYGGVQVIASDSLVTASLSRLVSAFHSKRNKTFMHVISEKVMTYKLANSGVWFKEVVREEATRKWLEQAIKQGEEVYVVVGYYTMLNAEITEDVATSSTVSVQFDVPVAATLAGMGAITPVGNALDTSVGGHQQKGKGVQRQFVASGEQICAIQFRKVRFKWFSSHNLDSAFLQKENRWKVYWDNRGQDVGTDDVVEADLQDDLEMGTDRGGLMSDIS